MTPSATINASANAIPIRDVVVICRIALVGAIFDLENVLASQIATNTTSIPHVHLFRQSTAFLVANRLWIVFAIVVGFVENRLQKEESKQN